MRRKKRRRRKRSSMMMDIGQIFRKSPFRSQRKSACQNPGVLGAHARTCESLLMYASESLLMHACVRAHEFACEYLPRHTCVRAHARTYKSLPIRTRVRAHACACESLLMHTRAVRVQCTQMAQHPHVCINVFVMPLHAHSMICW